MLESKRTWIARSFRNRAFCASLVLLSAMLVTGCGSSSDITQPTTYVGDITSARLEELYLATSDGKKLSFGEVFTGFEPETGFLTDSLPFPKVAVTDVIYDAAKPVAEYYDSKANDNGYLEGPELLVLYIRESAIGLGHPVDHIGVNPRVDALATSNADTGGLMAFVKKNKSGMTKNAQAIFGDIERIGLDWRSRGKGGGGAGR
jgi:hypothetical protein